MNDNHLQQIFAHYINKFQEINDPEHAEYFKWQVVSRFRAEMNATLSAPAGEFPAKLYEVKRLTENLIDSYTQPFYGLVEFAKKEPETVRSMFLNPYREDSGDLEDRQERIRDFLVKSHALREKYFADSYLYKDDMHSVTGYLFLYDPDHNYFFKATHAQIFADCVEFYDDWGTGDTVRLDVYYRMCDQLVERIKQSRELLATDESRFADGWGVDPDTLYKDPEKHVLAFDLIYCCSTYGLFDGISFVRPKSKERQLLQERKEKARELSMKLDEARRNVQRLEEAKEYANAKFSEGKAIRHRTYGEGIIRENDGSIITVDFPGNEGKRLGTFISVANGIISAADDHDDDRMAEYRGLLKKESSIKTGLSYAEKEFVQYAGYLDD